MSLSLRNLVVEINAATNTITVLNTTSAVFIRPSNESVLLTLATTQVRLRHPHASPGTGHLLRVSVAVTTHSSNSTLPFFFFSHF